MALRALITGIDGFTGRYLFKELEASGYTVFGLSAASTSGHTTFHCDICDAVAVREVVEQVRPDYVFHLAAIAFVQHGDVDNIYRTNILGSRNLLAALANCDHRPRGVLMVSSANVYGNVASGIVDEQTPAIPANDYAVSKLAMEHMANLWRDQLPITTVRTFNYSGVGQSRQFLLPKIVDHIRRRSPVLELGNLEVVRDFSDVRTVVEIYRRILEKNEPGKLFNVCSGVGYSLQNVLEMAREIAGYMPEIRISPALVRANEIKSLIGSNRALERAIGRVDGYQLGETLEWMLLAP